MNIYDEKALYLKEELEEYEKATPMTEEERNALREWVANGYSVHENPRMGVWEGNVPIDFLDVYRWEREEEKEHAMTSQVEFSPHESPQQMVPDEIPWFLPDEVRSIKRELAHLWEFVWQEGLGDDAQEFVSDRRDVETSFELY